MAGAVVRQWEVYQTARKSASVASFFTRFAHIRGISTRLPTRARQLSRGVLTPRLA